MINFEKVPAIPLRRPVPTPHFHPFPAYLPPLRKITHPLKKILGGGGGGGGRVCDL